MKVIIRGTGTTEKQNFWQPADTYEITITRGDEFKPSAPEILTALKLAVEAMTPKRKPRKKRVSEALDASQTEEQTA